jgi:hypothetical protein
MFTLTNWQMTLNARFKGAADRSLMGELPRPSQARMTTSSFNQDAES